MKLEEAKKCYLELKPYKKLIKSIDTDFLFNFAETVLSELDKKDRTIDNMAKEILRLDTEKSKDEYDHAKMWDTEEGIIEYFTNLAEKRGQVV